MSNLSHQAGMFRGEGIVMKHYKYIIYDLDGTLIDTRPGVKDAVKKTINDLGLVPLDKKTLESFVGPPMQDSFQKYFDFEEESALSAANLFRENYKKYSLFRGKVYPGIIEMLHIQKEREISIAVATNKSHENAMAILAYFGISDFCSYMRGTDMGGKLSKADIINLCIAELGASKKEVLYIGDSYYDSEGAGKVGIDFLGVTYGFGFRNHTDFLNVRHVAVCENVEDINRFLEIG